MPGPADPPVAGARRFVGRRHERTLLRHLMDQASAGQPAVVVVTGVPGCGKTALLRWAHDTAVAADIHVLRGAAYERAQPLDLLRRAFGSLPGVQARLAGSRASADLAEVADAVVTELAALGRRHPTLVLADDTQDVDAGSQLVLEHAVAMLDDQATHGGTGVLLVLSAREPAPADGLAARALRHDACRGVSLGGLDEHEVHELLVAAGLRVTPGLVSQVLEDTGGLPLLVEADVEVCRSGLHGRGGAGARPQRNARVRSITDAMQIRIDGVDPAAQRLLACAAVLGEPWEPQELVALAGVTPDAAADGLTAAQKADLVEPLGDGSLRFAHPLIRSELLDQLGKATQRSLHRVIAERLGATGADDDQTLFRVADHLVRAQPDVAPELLADVTLRAGRRAYRWGDWPQASRFLAVAAGALPERVDPAERAAVLVDAGDAAYFDHDPARCRDQLTEAIHVSQTVGDPDLRLRAATRLTLARNGLGETQVGVRPGVGELEAALADPAADPALRVGGAAVLADTLLASGETDRALAIVADARRTAATARTTTTTTTGPDPRSSDVDDALGRLELAEGIHRLVALELVDATWCFERGLGHASAAASSLTRLTLRARRALAMLLVGDVRRAATELATIEDEALDRRYWGEAGLAAAQRAACLSLTGDPGAVDAAERAAHMYRRTGFAYIAVGLAPVATAIETRARGAHHDAETASARLGLPTSSALAVLSSLEADDAVTARARLRTSAWRHGFRGAATLPGLAVLAAMVEAGDRLDRPDLVASARGPLTDAYEAGLVILASWPTTVPRLLAVAARHDRDLASARRYLDHAMAVCERQALRAEHPKVLLELARLELAGGGSTADATADAVLSEAVARFDRQSMHGWIARCESVASDLGLAPHFGGSRVAVRERTVFTDDIVGSTPANARLGDTLYLEQLRKHDRIVRAAVRRHRGVEIKHTGDGLNAVFDSSADALGCAAAVQGDFALWNAAEPDVALQVRCGLARGRLLPHGGDFFGLVQSEAARLCGLAAPGEVLASAAVIDDVDRADAPGIAWEKVGAHQLRGLPAVTQVHRIFHGQQEERA